MPSHKPPSLEWGNINPKNLWYLVGLITSDGSLSSDGRHIIIVAKDYQYLKKVKVLCSIPQKISECNKGRGNSAYRIQIGSRKFYIFLMTLGLTPNKSKTIGRISVPNLYFPDFLRGVIDGDGCLRRWVHPSNGHEQWILKITSGSKLFLEWISGEILGFIGVKGRIHKSDMSGHIYYDLKFGKLAAMRLSEVCYLHGNPDLYLERKYELAKQCILSSKGWSKSKTVE